MFEEYRFCCFIIYSQTETRVSLDSWLLEGEQQFPPFSSQIGGGDEALSFFIIACPVGLHLNIKNWPFVSGESGEMTRFVMQQGIWVGLVPESPVFEELRWVPEQFSAFAVLAWRRELLCTEHCSEKSSSV